MLAAGEASDNAIDLWIYADDIESPDSALTFTFDRSPIPCAGITIDHNRFVSIAPSDGWSGETTVGVRVTDPGDLWTRRTFQVTVRAGEQRMFLPIVRK